MVRSPVTGPAGRGAPTGSARFARFCARVVARLPRGLAAVVAPSLVGFAIINGFTFGLDLTLLTLARDALGWPVWASITGAYAVAFAVSFVLNRRFNFRIHGPVGRQTVRYVGVVVVNYVAILLGVGAGLAALGVPLPAARLVAGVVEAAWMYSAMRWVVFRRDASGRSGRPGP